MILLKDFWFDGPGKERWPAPSGSQIDGASIPQSLWTLVGSPYTGRYRRASIVHDVACVAARGDHAARRKADRMFYSACRAGGCSIREAIILYIGVRIGSTWNRVPQWSALALSDDQDARLFRSNAEVSVENDFRAASERVLSQGEVDDVDEIERRTDEALSRVTGLNFSAF